MSLQRLLIINNEFRAEPLKRTIAQTSCPTHFVLVLYLDNGSSQSNKMQYDPHGSVLSPCVSYP